MEEHEGEGESKFLYISSFGTLVPIEKHLEEKRRLDRVSKLQELQPLWRKKFGYEFPSDDLHSSGFWNDDDTIRNKMISMESGACWGRFVSCIFLLLFSFRTQMFWMAAGLLFPSSADIFVSLTVAVVLPVIFGLLGCLIRSFAFEQCNRKAGCLGCYPTTLFETYIRLLAWNSRFWIKCVGFLVNFLSLFVLLVIYLSWDWNGGSQTVRCGTTTLSTSKMLYAIYDLRNTFVPAYTNGNATSLSRCSCSPSVVKVLCFFVIGILKLLPDIPNFYESAESSSIHHNFGMLFLFANISYRPTESKQRYLQYKTVFDWFLDNEILFAVVPVKMLLAPSVADIETEVQRLADLHNWETGESCVYQPHWKHFTWRFFHERRSYECTRLCRCFRHIDSAPRSLCSCQPIRLSCQDHCAGICVAGWKRLFPCCGERSCCPSPTKWLGNLVLRIVIIFCLAPVAAFVVHLVLGGVGLPRIPGDFGGYVAVIPLLLVFFIVWGLWMGLESMRYAQEIAFIEIPGELRHDQGTIDRCSVCMYFATTACCWGSGTAQYQVEARRASTHKTFQKEFWDKVLESIPGSDRDSLVRLASAVCFLCREWSLKEWRPGEGVPLFFTYCKYRLIKDGMDLYGQIRKAVLLYGNGFPPEEDMGEILRNVEELLESLFGRRRMKA